MPASSLDELVALCKRRGFIFQSSEIYGGLQGVYDYGPLGVELKNNLKQAWWRRNVYERDDMEGLDASVLTHRLVLHYSGHEATFADPMVDNRITKKRYRLDHLLKEQPEEVLKRLYRAMEVEEENLHALVQAMMQAPERAGGAMTAAGVLDPASGEPGDWTPPRYFNMMFKTYVGPVEDEASLAYLRPETAQGIFVNFKNVLDATSRKLPFGIAQIGKAFRNEITPRNFIFRVREFEQMEIEYFVRPGEDEYWHRYWVEERLKWWQEMGLSRENLVPYQQPPEELAHYAKATVDILYRFPHGLEELEGIANRTDFDLGSHTKDQEALGITARVLRNEHSTQRLAYRDPETGKWFVPYVIEPSAGVDRGVLALLAEAFTREELPNGEERIVLAQAPARPHQGGGDPPGEEPPGDHRVRQAPQGQAPRLGPGAGALRGHRQHRQGLPPPRRGGHALRRHRGLRHHRPEQGRHHPAQGHGHGAGPGHHGADKAPRGRAGGLPSGEA